MYTHFAVFQLPLTIPLISWRITHLALQHVIKLFCFLSLNNKALSCLHVRFILFQHTDLCWFIHYLVGDPSMSWFGAFAVTSGVHTQRCASFHVFLSRPSRMYRRTSNMVGLSYPPSVISVLKV